MVSKKSSLVKSAAVKLYSPRTETLKNKMKPELLKDKNIKVSQKEHITLLEAHVQLLECHAGGVVCHVGADQSLTEEHQVVGKASVEPGVGLRPAGAAESDGPDARQRGPSHRHRERLL